MKVTIFDQYANEYDGWFDDHSRIYRAEVAALRRIIPRTGTGIEVGVGTGRFAAPLEIRTGIEPSESMARIAQSRNIAVCQAVGEQLPFADGQFDFALLVTVVCFVKDAAHLLREARRIVKVGGKVITAFIDKESALGQLYQSRKDEKRFYKEAHFYSTPEIIALIQRVGLGEVRACQTLIGLPDDSTTVYQIRKGYGAGAFVALSATKLSLEGDDV